MIWIDINTLPIVCEEVLCKIENTGWLEAYRVLEYCDGEWSDWEGNVYTNVSKWMKIPKT